MRFLGRYLPDGVFLIPASMGVLLLGYSIYQVMSQVRSSFVFIGLYSLFGIVGVLVYYRYQPLGDERRQLPVSTSLIRRLLSVGFFATLAGAILSLEFLNPGAIRPASFFGFVSIGVGILAVRAILFAESRRDGIWLIGLVFLLGGAIRLSMVYLNPYPYVSDTQFHWYIVQETISRGEFVGGGPYNAHPLFHLFSAGFLLLADSTATFEGLFPLVNSMVIVGAIPVIYLIGRRLGSAKVGFIASVILLFSGRFFPSIQYKTNWFGIVLLLLAFLGILHIGASQAARTQYGVLLWVFTISVLLIHPVNFVVLLALAAGSFVAVRLVTVEQTGSISRGGWISPVPLFSAGAIFVGYLTLVNFRVFSSLVISAVGISTSGSERLGLTTNIAQAPLMSEFTFELAINFLGLTAPVLGIVLGIFVLSEKVEFPTNATLFGIVAVYALVALVLLGGRGGDLSITRMLLYIAPIGAVAAGVGVVRLESRFDLRRGMTLLFILVVLVSFLAMSSYINSNGIFTDTVQTSPSTVTASTLAAHQFLTYIPAGSALTSTDTTAEYIASDNPVRGMHQLEDAERVRRYYQDGWASSQYYILNTATLSLYDSQTGPDFRGLPKRLEPTHSRIYANTQLAIYSRSEPVRSASESPTS